MAYYAALVSLVQLLEDITRPDPPYAKSFLDKQQIHVSLYEKFNLVQELLDHSSKNHHENSTDILESRIRDAAYHAQDIIESDISDLFQQREDFELEKVKTEVGSIVEELMTIKESHTTHEEDLQKRYHQDLEKVKTNVGSIVEELITIKDSHLTCEENKQKKYHQELQKVKFEVDSILEEMMVINMESLTTNEHNLHIIRHCASTQAPSNEAPKVKAPSGRNTMVVVDEHLMTTIKGQLCGESSKLEVISVVGMGGLGKTTLARNIFDDKLIEDRFDCHSWVTVSQDYHMRNILLAIVDSLKMKKGELKEEEKENLLEELKEEEKENLLEGLKEEEKENLLKDNIYKHLFGRRYLIILDDMWETKVWDDIKRIFPENSNRSRIMITTRVLDVAVYADCSSKFLNQMQFLNEEQSWALLQQKVFAQEHCPKELEVIGKLIAKNCRGLPLAIVVIAGVLSNVNKAQHDWENIARNVSSTAIDQNDEHLSKILSLSYNHLPHHLKPCFLYLGGFPEDREIPISKLIRLWVAEGFLKPIKFKSLEEVGKEYFKDLVDRNLVLLTKKNFHGKFKYCSIHDLLRELCSQRAHSDNFLLCLHQKDDFHRTSMGNLHRVYIQTWDDSLFLLEHVSHVRSVISFAIARYHHLLSIVSNSQLLRILDTGGVELHENDWDETNRILNFLHLRHLDIVALNIQFPPSIFKLQNLQTLIVRGRISLPYEIWKMPHLRHIISFEVTVAPIPDEEIKIIDRGPLLGSLQTLSNVQQFIFTRDTVEMIPNLKRLKVRCHDVEVSNVWEEFGLNNLVHLHQLESLHIECCRVTSLPENFAFPSTVIKLSLEGCKLPWKDMTVVGSLPNLQKLKLIVDAFVGEEWKPTEGEFLKLKILVMRGLNDLKYWEAENTHFPCLEQIHIHECSELEEIPHGIVDTLQFIEVVACSSGLGSSALKIQQAQWDEGNDDFQVRVIPNLRYPFAEEDESNAEEDESSAEENE